MKLTKAERSREGAAGLTDQFTFHRERLLRLVHHRMDRRLRKRVNASDVVQETYLDAARRIDQYDEEEARKMPFFGWLRFLALQKLCSLHRAHLGTRKRDAARETPLHAESFSDAHPGIGELRGDLTSPSQAAIRSELQVHLRDALATLAPIDREVLSMRHLDQLSNREVSERLGLTFAAASNRYVRALSRFRDVVAEIPGLQDHATSAIEGGSSRCPRASDA